MFNLEQSKRAVLASQYGTKRFSLGRRRETENIIDLIRAEIIVQVLAVKVAIVYIWSTHQQVGSLNMPAREREQ